MLAAARWRIVHQRLPHITNLDLTNLGGNNNETQATLDSLYPKLVAYITDQTHSVVRKGCIVAGIRHLRTIPGDDHLSMSPEKLEEQMKVCSFA